MQRVLEVEHGTFTPLIMGTNGGMGGECEQFISRLANKLAIKRNELYSTVKTWLRIRLSFEIVRSALLCVKAGLHFQSFCSPIKALKVEFISTFRTNENALARSTLLCNIKRNVMIALIGEQKD